MKVKGGRVQKKNRQVPTTHRGWVFYRASAKKGYRHVVSKKHILEFVALIPDWEALSEGLEGIRLGGGDDSVDGWYRYYPKESTGLINIDAWRAGPKIEMDDIYYETHQHLFKRFGMCVVDVRKAEGWDVYFSDIQARAFLLLHVFLHELGHHRQRMLSRHNTSKLCESYAENFANDRLEVMWPLYNEKIEKVR